MAQALGDAASRATALVDGVTGLLAGGAARDRDAPTDPDRLMHLPPTCSTASIAASRAASTSRPRRASSPSSSSTAAPSAFRAFAERFDPAAPDLAARAAYGTGAALLEAEWRASLERPGGAVSAPSAGLLGRML